MNTYLVSGLWTAIGNHLWQSTLFAVAAALVALALRKNQARVRYWLWLAASLKFLVPFAVLVSLGSHFAKVQQTAAETDFYSTVTDVSEPFAGAVAAAATAPAPVAHGSLTAWIPATLAGVWVCGSLGILGVWCVRWRRVAASLKDAIELRGGREWQALRRLQDRGDLPSKVRLMVSSASIEPAAFGILHPVILWPEGISELACVPGVTGADLKGRIVRIMSERLGTQLGLGRKLGLAALALAALVGPAVFGLVEVPHVQAEWTQSTDGPQLTFDAVSIKPNKSGGGDTTWHTTLEHYNGTNVPLKELISDAYGLQSSDLVYGLSGWAISAHYDIEAKVDAETLAALKAMSPAESSKQVKAMLREVLAERFQLKAHDETKEIPVYALVVAKGGLKLRRADPNDTYANGLKGPDGKAYGGDSMWSNNGRMVAQGYSITNLAVILARRLHRDVVDKTGLTGKYDFTMNFSPELTAGDAPPDTETAPSLFTALEEQLGLKLESTKGPVATVVVDHVAAPVEN